MRRNRSVNSNRIIELLEMFVEGFWLRFRCHQAVIDGQFRAFTDPNTEDLVLWAVDYFSSEQLMTIYDWPSSIGLVINKLQREEIEEGYSGIMIDNHFDATLEWWGEMTQEERVKHLMDALLPSERNNLEGTIKRAEFLICELIEDESLRWVEDFTPIALTAG